MTEKYNKYYDTYIKQKTTGAITGGYAFQVDGNSNLNGNVNASNLNVTTLATCPTVISTDNSTNIATTAFVKTSLSPYALISNLSSYNGGSIDLSSYVTSSALASALNPYALISNLSSYGGSGSGGSVDLSSYLTSSNAATIYQTISGMTSYVLSSTLTTTLSSYLTSATASSTYQTISGMSSYVLSSALTTTLSSYLTSATASSTYQTISGMSSYLTKTNAATIYQTIAGMNSYVTNVYFTDTLNDFSRTSDADALYQTKVDAADYFLISQFSTSLTPYLTISNASLTYQPSAAMVDYLTKYEATTLYQTITSLSSYQTISGMSSYLTTANASSIYLTTSNASSTYQTIADMSNYLLSSTVQPFSLLMGAGANPQYITSAAGEIWGKNNNSGATGYLITYAFAGYTLSSTSGWNSANGFYYVPIAGTYSISINIYKNSDTSGNRYLLTRHNSAGTPQYSVYIHAVDTTHTSDKIATFSITLRMFVGEYFKVSLSVRNGTSNWNFGSSPSYSSMSVARIG